MYLGAHNPLDVLGGIGLGLAVGGAADLIVGVPAPGATTTDASTADATSGRGADPRPLSSPED